MGRGSTKRIAKMLACQDALYFLEPSAPVVPSVPIPTEPAQPQPGSTLVTDTGMKPSCLQPL